MECWKVSEILKKYNTPTLHYSTDFKMKIITQDQAVKNISSSKYLRLKKWKM